MRRCAKVILLCSSALVSLGKAHGQEIAAADTTAADTIVVTGNRVEGFAVTHATLATKTDTPLIDTPQSVQVISNAVIKAMGATDLYDVVRNVSGVTRRASYWGQNTATFNIRGFDLDNENGYLKDGLRYFAEGTVVLGNVDHVEILKGPASVLYGRAQPGGIANMVSKMPSAKFSGGVELAAGRWNSYSINADINGTLNGSETLVARIDAEYDEADSFRDTVWNKTLMLAPQLLWKPDQNTLIRLKVEYVRDERKPDYGIPAFGNRPANVPLSTYYGEPFDYQRSAQINVALSAEHHFSEDWLVRASLSYYRLKYPAATRDTFNSWVDGTTLNRYYENFPKSNIYRTAQVETVGKFGTFGLKHTLLLGAEYDTHDLAYTDNISSNNPLPVDIFHPVPIGSLDTLLSLSDPILYNSEDREKSWSLYFQDQIDLTDKWKLLVGGRYDHVTSRGTYLGAFVSDGSTAYGGIYGYTASAFSPRAGLLYKVNDGLSLFASWSKSFNPNSADCDPVTGVCLDFPPEKGLQYEGGVKYEAAGGRFTASVALFQIEKTNVVQTDPNNPTQSVVDGKHGSKGVELDLAGEPLKGLNVIASYAYIDAKILESSDYPVGAALPNAARHTASLWASYDLKLGNDDTLSFGGGGNYQSRRSVDSTDTIFMPGYAIFNAMIAYERGGWRVALNFDNLTDKRFFESSTGYGGAVIYPGTPRSWRLSLAKRF